MASVFFFGMAFAFLIFALIIHTILRYWGADDGAAAVIAFIFVLVALLWVAIGLYPLCLAIKGCTNCDAVEDMKRVDRSIMNGGAAGGAPAHILPN